jgi:Family of unknown function (DUF6152)
MHSRLIGPWSLVLGPWSLVLAAAGIIVMLTPRISAHHSFSAEFDSTKSVTLDGEVVMMEWVNPHSWLHIDVKKPDGSVERWKIEGGSPSVLMRLGWNRNSLPVGTRVTVVGFQAKDGSLRASSRELRFPDGRRLDLGGSGSTTIDQKR